MSITDPNPPQTFLNDLLNPAYDFDERGLVVQREMDYLTWAACYADAHQRKSASAWAFFDAVIYGEDRHPDQYGQIIRATEINYGSLRNGVYINRRFPREKRVYRLSRSHYAAVAALPDAVAHQLLSRAERDEASQDEVREWVREIARRCPECRHTMLLSADGTTWLCTNDDCGNAEPVQAADDTPPQEIRVEGLVVEVGDDLTGFVKVAVSRDQEYVHTLKYAQKVTVIFTPRIEAE